MKTLKNIIEPCLVALIIIALFLPYTNFLGQRITPIDFLYMDGINTLGLNIMIRLPVALLLPYIIIHFSGTHTYRHSFKLLKILFLITQFVIITTYILVYISYGSSLYETIPAVILSITLMLISLKYAKDQRTILKNVLFSSIILPFIFFIPLGTAFGGIITSLCISFLYVLSFISVFRKKN